MKARAKANRKGHDAGVALILVMLAILVLTTLAIAMVFSARSETFASYNYRIGTQAEFVARAGVQKALNFFESASYAPVDPIDTDTYNVTNGYTLPVNALLLAPHNANPYATNPVNMYYSLTNPVTCQSSVTGCSSGSPVTLSTSSGSNYPGPPYTGGVNVVANWASAMNGQTLYDGVGSPSGSGSFTVTATLLDYHTVNNAQYGTPAASCTDPLAGVGICRTPYEVWQVTSTGTWNSNVGAGAEQPTVRLVATISPMYLPYTGNAFYGLCGVTISGNVCTDSYNGSTGDYGNYSGSGTNPAYSCPQPAGTTNAQTSYAGIGSNGGVTINGGASFVGGNVTYANADTGSSSSCNTGFTGTSTGVTGSVLPGPAIPTPILPNMTTWGYGTTTPPVVPANGCSSGAPPPCVANVIMKATTPPNANTEYAGVVITDPTGTAIPLTGACPTGYSGYIESYKLNVGSPNTITNYTCTGISGSGTSTSPYILGDVSSGSSGSNPGAVNFVAPSTGSSNPVYVAEDSVNVSTKGYINTSNTVPIITTTTAPNGVDSPYPTSSTATAFVMDDYGDLNIGGTADMNFNPNTPGVPSPADLVMNIEGSKVTLSGQAQLSAVIIAPNASVSLGGSGSTGTFFGSILGNNVTDKGNYPVHYDTSLSRLSGKLYSVQVVSVSRTMY